MFEMLTPCYLIDVDSFKNNLMAFRMAFSYKWNNNVSFGYSIKTNHDQFFLKLAKEYGMYAEAVSDDEYNAALMAGYKAREIIFNGPQKTPLLLIDALRNGGIINLDNEDELKMLKENNVKGINVTARVGLRVNFDLESLCPGETTAGEQVSRFGFCVENGEFASAVKQLHELGISVAGLHMHFSTKSRSERVFKELARKAASLILDYNLLQEIKYIDMGGGFFFGKNSFSTGKPSLDSYASIITDELKKAVNPDNVELILEPGASLISTAVTYYAKIINQRMIRGTKILTVDGSDLHINPFMVHRNTIYNIIYSETDERKMIPKQIICGATCMENDRIAYLDHQSELFPGDVIVCYCAGSYSMGFNSCFINLPPYVFAKRNDNIEIIRGKNKDLLKEI